MRGLSGAAVLVPLTKIGLIIVFGLAVIVGLAGNQCLTPTDHVQPVSSGQALSREALNLYAFLMERVAGHYHAAGNTEISTRLLRRALDVRNRTTPANDPTLERLRMTYEMQLAHLAEDNRAASSMAAAASACQPG